MIFRSVFLFCKVALCTTRYCSLVVEAAYKHRENTVNAPNILEILWEFCGKAQFPHSFGRFSRNHAKTISFHKISTPGN